MHREEKGTALACNPAFHKDIAGKHNISEKHKTDATKWQASYIAQRYRLKPSIARLVCELQGFGRAA